LGITLLLQKKYKYNITKNWYNCIVNMNLMNEKNTIVLRSLLGHSLSVPCYKEIKYGKSE
jgi:hypothetical protein